MHDISRMARNAASVLVNLGEGRGLLGIESARRSELEATLLEATGCRRGEGRDRAWILRDGVRLTTGIDALTHTAMEEGMRAWLRGKGPAPRPPRVALPSGAVAIMERCGLVADRAVTMVETVGYARLDTADGAIVSLSRTQCGLRLEYAHRGVRWRDGVVSLRHRQIPGTVAASLVGRRLGALVDDPVIADRTVRRICDVDPREGVLRVVTSDEGRTVVMGDG